jgi:hypothetical protein
LPRIDLPADGCPWRHRHPRQRPPLRAAAQPMSSKGATK